mgnify:CR=1 FL=1
MRFMTVILFFGLLPLIGFSQGSSVEEGSGEIFSKIENTSDHNIRIQQDSSVRQLILRHVAKNRKNPRIEGYRIRIYSDLGTHAREEWQNVKAEFYEKFPEIPVYQDYDEPYYKVYVGDFRTKIEAVKFLKKIRKEFPSAFVVPDQINFPELN